MNRFNGTIFNGVFALTADSTGSIYAGGDFYSPGNYIAKWNASTSTWTHLGSGMNNNVWALTTDASGNLYAGGDFTTAGGVTVNRIAKWNGSTWTALGTAPHTGVDGRVLALTTDASGNLYAGGNFTTAGGVTVNRIAMWDGSTWTALGTGMNMTVYALAFDAGNLYAAGSFTQVNGVAINRVAKWNGTSWSALGGGLNNTVTAVATDAGNLYAGGYFTTAGGETVNGIAKWNGASWSALGSGVTNSGERIDALRVDTASNVYAAGAFLNIGGVPANRIAKWNGTSWSALGTGMNMTVHALAFDAGNLYAGGSFTTAGGTSVNRIASLSVASPALDPTFDSPVRTEGGFTVNVTNYDANYTWTPSVSTGSVSAGTPSGSTLPLTVTGLANGSTAAVTVTTSRSGYSNGSATVVGQAKSAQTVTWAPTAAITTVQSPITPSSLATALGGAPVTYSVTSHTTLTCTVDANSGVLTYTGTGTCVVRATAAATADYLEGTADVTFTVSRAAQSVTWAPVTALTLPGSTATPAAASGLGGAPISYAKVSNTTATCEVDSSTGAITYAGAGNCVVRATAASTADYDSGSIDVTFTVTKATPTLTWNPNLAVEVPAGSTTYTAATSSGDGAITYAVTNAGTTGCSLPSVTSRTLSFTAAGSCEVTATAAATTDYNAVSSVKTFAVSKAAQVVTWSPSSTLTLATMSAILPAATTSGDGAITYTVTSAGGTGCSFADATQPVLTYSTTGSCSVTATAAETGGYAQGTQSVTITIALATPTMSWSPTTALSMPAATVTPATASTTADGAITYAVTSDAGAGCSVDANTGALSYTATGQCQVTATSTATPRYAAGSTAVTFTISLAPQTITANATSTSLRPGQTTTVSASGSSGSGSLTWTRTTGAGVCSLTGTTVRALADGACVLTVDISPDATYAAASDTITITVSTPPPPPGGGGGSSGGGSGGGASGGTSGDDSSSSIAGPSTGLGSGSASGGGSNSPTSQDGVTVPGSSAPTAGRALPPPPTDVVIKPVPGRSRSAVLIKQPAGVSGSQVTSTVVVVRDDNGKVISRINVALKKGQGEIEVTVPFVAEGYSVNVYNVNDVGVSTGGLRTSPLIKATTITKRTPAGRPALFGTRLGKPIVFAGGSARLDAGDRKELRAIARQAKASNDRLFVTGFALKGGGGSAEVGPLSTARAKAAANYLAQHGVRVWIRYWGAGSLNGTGKATDRRVEIRTSPRPIPRSLVP